MNQDKIRTRTMLVIASALVLMAPSVSSSSDASSPGEDNARSSTDERTASPTTVPENVMKRARPGHQGLRRSRRGLPHVERLLTADKGIPEFAGWGHEYLRFEEIPDHVQRRFLRARGVLLTGYAGDHTYVAVVNERGREFLRSMPGVMEQGAIPVEGKIDPELLRAEVNALAKDEEGRALIGVRFHHDTTLDDARLTVELHGGTVLDDRAFLMYDRLDVALDRDSIPDLASADPVSHVSVKRSDAIAHNRQAAEVSRTDVLWDPPYELNGAGYGVGVWDLGLIYPHPEFGTRITLEEDPEEVPFSSHATHVAGTIGAAGDLGTVDSENAHGMAAQVNLSSYDFNQWDLETASAIIAGQLVASCNAWGVLVGWEFFPGCGQPDGCLPPIPPQWYLASDEANFGSYSVDSGDIDSAAQFAESTGQTFLIVRSAGNHRDDPDESGLPHDGTIYDNPDEQNPYYDTIGPLGMAKNEITVGSVTHLKEMTVYSGWGPADDGRVKPDLVAMGQYLFSPATATDYQYLDGTSQAAAVVTGSAVLVVEQYEDSFGVPPTNGELKALLLNTAADLGNPGPDYVYGYGLLQTQAAVDLILSDGDTSSIHSGQLDQGEMDSYVIDVLPGTPAIKCTLAWMDPPGLPGGGPALVNDLDLRLVSPTDQVHYPYSLSAGNPVADATAVGPNTVDTVEQVLVLDPAPGSWTVEVEGQSVPSGPQKYGLVSRNSLSTPAVFDVLPPEVLLKFPYPYRRPILSAKYVDPIGSGIDVDAVTVFLNAFNVTSVSVIGPDGAYYQPTFDLWLDEFSFSVNAVNVEGAASMTTVQFDIVDAREVENLTVTPGGSGEIDLEWSNPGYIPDLTLLGSRIYRSTDLQANLEWIGTSNTTTFTDSEPPASGLVTYEVHSLFASTGGDRILSTRTTPHRTQQPFIASPRDSSLAPLPPGSFEVRFWGMSEPQSEVKVYVDDSELGTTTTANDGSFSLLHDFGGPGQHTVVVQAKSENKSISVPSVEINFEIPPAE